LADYQPLRQCISNNDDEIIIYGADNFSQFPRRNASVRSKSERTLPAARRDDLVVLRGKLDREYHNWLRSLGLGTDYIVEYNAPVRGKTLSELIVENPEPVRKIIRETGRSPVYVPWFSGRMETEAANALGADLFGSSESATLKYNDKVEFKTLCRQLGVPVVNGFSFKMQPTTGNNFQDMVSLVNQCLTTHKTAIIRGTLGESGMSLYKTNGNDIADIYSEIAASGENAVIIEPLLNVISSPNDQWIISRDGSISHLGIANQICERGMVHIGTLEGQGPSLRICDDVTQASLKIVTNMAEFGYTGVVGIDYIVTPEGIFPVENNARFNGSSYVRIIVNNIEELTTPIPCWKFIKIKTPPCSFDELTQRIEPVLYDGNKLNSVFPFTCDTLPFTGDFAVVLLAEDLDHISYLEESLKEMEIKRN